MRESFKSKIIEVCNKKMDRKTVQLMQIARL